MLESRVDNCFHGTCYLKQVVLEKGIGFMFSG